MSNEKIVKGKKIKFVLDNFSLGRFFFDCGERFADRICQIDAIENVLETYASVKLRTIRLAIELQKIGITSKNVIASCSYNSVDSAIPIIASLYIGSKIVNLDPKLSIKNTTYLLDQVKPTVTFVDVSCLPLIEESLTKTHFKTNLIILNGHSDKYLNLKELNKTQPNEDKFTPAEVDIQDVAVMFFSSGTTGFPKAICHSHYSFLKLTEIADNCGIHTEKVLHFTTFYWISGMMMLTTTFLSGNTRIFACDMDGEKVLKVIEKYKVQSLFLAPIYTYNLTNVKNPERFDTSSLKSILTGGTAMSIEQFKRLDNKFENADIVFGYGMTEVGMITCFNPKTDKAFIKNKIGSCGRIAPESLIKVVDINTEEILGVNQKGEIRVKSPALMVGYYNRDSSECFDSDGYLKTGDVGYYDEDKCFYVVERIKEMFKYRSWHIVPSSIEAILLEHPAVKEAVVFGVPSSDEEGEVPAACVVLNEDYNVDKQDIESFVEKRVSDVEKLRGGVTIVDTLQKTPTGKYMRNEIKETMIKSLNKY